MLVDHRNQLSNQRVATVNRLQRLLAELTPGQAKKDITALQAKAILASVRPRDIVGKTRRRVAADELANLMAIEKRSKPSPSRSGHVNERGSAPDRSLRRRAHRGRADPGRRRRRRRFADRNRFASWTGTAPLDASSGEQTRHRLSRAGNRRINHMLHMAATTQIRLDTDRPGLLPAQARRRQDPHRSHALPQARISDAVYRQLVADAPPPDRAWHGPGRALRGVS